MDFSTALELSKSLKDDERGRQSSNVYLTAASDSSGGEVLVDWGDGEQSLVPIIGGAKEGDTVQVSIQDGSAVAIGSTGWGDAVEQSIQAIGEATQYITKDATGLYVHTNPDDINSGYNLRMVNDGIELRNGTEVLAHFTADEVSLNGDTCHIKAFSHDGETDAYLYGKDGIFLTTGNPSTPSTLLPVLAVTDDEVVARWRNGISWPPSRNAVTYIANQAATLTTSNAAMSLPGEIRTGGAFSSVHEVGHAVCLLRGYVMVSASMEASGVHRGDQLRLRIYRKSGDTVTSLCYGAETVGYAASDSTSVQAGITFAPKMVQVEAGDEIYMQGQNQTAARGTYGGTDGNQTHLTVQYVDFYE